MLMKTFLFSFLFAGTMTNAFSIVGSQRQRSKDIVMLMMGGSGKEEAAAAASSTTKLSSSETLTRLQELVGEHLAIDNPTSKIKASTNFKEDLGADSLDVIELVLAVENEFDISIDDDYASKIVTINDALEYLKDSHNIEVDTPPH